MLWKDTSQTIPKVLDGNTLAIRHSSVGTRIPESKCAYLTLDRKPQNLCADAMSLVPFWVAKTGFYGCLHQLLSCIPRTQLS
jgi:hypothetical protein